jgi:uncharacterized protein (DUF58 family)
MESSTPRKQLNPLFTNDELGRIERLRINPNRKRTNRSQGEHYSGKGGSSIDFSDYRDYAAGDDTRYIDWNIFARLRRPYIKLYSHEEELHVTVLIDASSSMQMEGKFERAKQLAAAFATMGLLGGERVSVYACHNSGAGPSFAPRLHGRVAMRRVFQLIESLEPGGDAPIEQSIETMLRLHRGRGVVVIVSDFLTIGDLPRSFNLLNSSGLEIFGLQILGPSELEPDLTGDLRFVDCENGATLDVSSARELLAIYHEHRQALTANLEAHCRRRNGRFTQLSSTDELKTILFDSLLRKGWVQ